MIKMALDLEDWATWNFLQCFMKEQPEEENSAFNFLNKTKDVVEKKQQLMRYIS
jgi:ferritin